MSKKTTTILQSTSTGLRRLGLIAAAVDENDRVCWSPSRAERDRGIGDFDIHVNTIRITHPEPLHMDSIRGVEKLNEDLTLEPFFESNALSRAAISAVARTRQ